MARHESAHTAMVDLKRSNARDSSWSPFPEQFQSTGRQTQQGAQTDVVALRVVTQLPRKMEKAAMREESEEQPSGNFGAPSHGRIEWPSVVDGGMVGLVSVFSLPIGKARRIRRSRAGVKQIRCTASTDSTC